MLFSSSKAPSAEKIKKNTDRAAKTTRKERLLRSSAIFVALVLSIFLLKRRFVYSFVFICAGRELSITTYYKVRIRTINYFLIHKSPRENLVKISRKVIHSSLSSFRGGVEKDLAVD